MVPKAVQTLFLFIINRQPPQLLNHMSSWPQILTHHIPYLLPIQQKSNYLIVRVELLLSKKENIFAHIGNGKGEYL